MKWEDRMRGERVRKEKGSRKEGRKKKARKKHYFTSFLCLPLLCSSFFTLQKRAHFRALLNIVSLITHAPGLPFLYHL
jgi:hypothetical protein